MLNKIESTIFYFLFLLSILFNSDPRFIHTLFDFKSKQIKESVKIIAPSKQEHAVTFLTKKERTNKKKNTRTVLMTRNKIEKKKKENRDTRADPFHNNCTILISIKLEKCAFPRLC